jgi:hypothetical protein
VANDPRADATARAVRARAERIAFDEARDHRIFTLTGAIYFWLSFTPIYVAAPLLGALLNLRWPEAAFSAVTTLALVYGCVEAFTTVSLKLLGRSWAWPWTLLIIEAILSALALYPHGYLPDLLRWGWVHSALVAAAWVFGGVVVGFFSLVFARSWSSRRLERKLSRDHPEDRLICGMVDIAAELLEPGMRLTADRQKRHRERIDELADEFERSWPTSKVEQSRIRLANLAKTIAGEIACTIRRHQRDLLLDSTSAVEFAGRVGAIVADIEERKLNPAEADGPSDRTDSRWRRLLRMVTSTSMVVLGLVLLIFALVQPWIEGQLRLSPQLSGLVVWSDQLRLGFGAIGAGMVVRSDKVLLQFATRMAAGGASGRPR